MLLVVKLLSLRQLASDLGGPLLVFLPALRLPSLHQNV